MTIAASLFVYAVMQKGNYDIQCYNRKNCPKPEKMTDTICGCIIMAATILFLIWSMVFYGWEICWIVFPAEYFVRHCQRDRGIFRKGKNA